jgi:bifunctional non-homologous end joining protein LigD
MTWRDEPSHVRPMLASTAEAPLQSPDLAYEPKYDGIRAVIAVEPQSHLPSVRLWSRLGNDKTSQFPEIVAAIAQWARGIDRPLLIDGEIVALDEHGRPSGFQNLQGRIHLRRPGSGHTGTAFIAFDLLRDGNIDLREKPLRERRAQLEKLFGGTTHPAVRLGEHAVGDGGPLRERAEELGWEGLVAKRLDSLYRSGHRTPDWRKLKLVRTQTCVVGGWTDPRGSRPFFGALLLGVYEEGELHYIGHSGAGFTDAELGRVWKRLRDLQTRKCPFVTTPRTNERPHWVEPKLVAEVKFTEWTADDKLRHPTYLGLRDDVDPKSVRREPDAGRSDGRHLRVRLAENLHAHPHAQPRPAAADRARGPAPTKSAIRALIQQLDAIQHGGGDGALELPGGERLEVTNLGKVFWPKGRLTKGDLLRHYVRVAPYILPVVADRPLVMKRYPNGINAKPFYQHRAPEPVPGGVRVETVESDNETRPHLVGGSLQTLLYMGQLASISQDPWFSRAGSEEVIDHVAIDLDPPEGLPFSRVLDVARWVRDELSSLKAPAFPKTSGSGGLHVYIPMPPQTPYDAGLLYGQIVATMVARKHPKVATIERSLRARGRRVYVDFLQNVKGKTLACAYSARASDFAGVSTPVTWDEIDEGVDPRDYTVRSFGERLEAAGDVWSDFRRAKGADLRAVMKYAEP